MHAASVAPSPRTLTDDAERARCGDARWLSKALQASRADTLATFDATAAALPGLNVPQRPELNPPLWELGHVGWFQAWWLARNPQWRQGPQADPGVARRPPAHAAAAVEPGDPEALYDSSRVPHAARWQLPLPDAATTRAALAGQLEATLELLHQADGSPQQLYFFRLALLHEDMHHEAALYMARGLDLPVADARRQPRRLPPPPDALRLPGGRWTQGSPIAQGFAFDNECPPREQVVDPFEIDAQVLRWADYLPFVEATGHVVPRYLRRGPQGWVQRCGGRWQPLDPDEPACHLRLADALAWCRWAGRRLPTEPEWEWAAAQGGDAFRWGDVWEWTATPFAPFEGFEPHPYRDYSAPWFDGRPVLKGASHLTQPRMRHPRYRNYFPGTRDDVPAGLRSCRLQP